MRENIPIGVRYRKKLKCYTMYLIDFLLNTKVFKNKLSYSCMAFSQSFVVIEEEKQK